MAGKFTLQLYTDSCLQIKTPEFVLKINFIHDATIILKT